MIKGIDWIAWELLPEAASQLWPLSPNSDQGMITYKNKTYTFSEFVIQLQLKLWNFVCRKAYSYWFYPYLYRSTWHALFSWDQKTVKKKKCYYSAIPNPGAGIGHQLANWNAGLYYAKCFDVEYAHSQFSNARWENFFGFYKQLPIAEDLILNGGYKRRYLPLFLDGCQKGKRLNQRIVNSYSAKKVVLFAERDQFFRAQYPVIPELKRLFKKSGSCSEDLLNYNSEFFNIAVHVRRTVIIDSQVIFEDDATRKKRFLSGDYYLKVLRQLIQAGRFPRPIRLYIFSTTELEEFDELRRDLEVISCHDWDEYTSFLHLVRADLLVTSKSGFSYMAAFFNDGFKICPRNYWHDYPVSRDWILAENSGEIDIKLLNFR